MTHRYLKKKKIYLKTIINYYQTIVWTWLQFADIKKVCCSIEKPSFEIVSLIWEFLQFEVLLIIFSTKTWKNTKESSKFMH